MEEVDRWINVEAVITLGPDSDTETALDCLTEETGKSEALSSATLFADLANRVVVITVPVDDGDEIQAHEVATVIMATTYLVLGSCDCRLSSVSFSFTRVCDRDGYLLPCP